MKSAYKKWSVQVDASVAGKDYPEGKVRAGEPESHFWRDDERYKPFFDEWKKRPEYSGWLNKKKKAKKRATNKFRAVKPQPKVKKAITQ